MCVCVCIISVVKGVWFQGDEAGRLDLSKSSKYWWRSAVFAVMRFPGL